MDIDLGMHENIPCHIQRSQQRSPEDQHGCAKNDAHTQIKCNGIAGDFSGLFGLP
ncbi:hypothetical protein D3C84_1221250 [compost metagenome]